MADVPAIERIHEARFTLLEGVEGTFRRRAFLGIFEFTHSNGYIYSKAFICPECGRLWGRISYFIHNQPDLHHSYEAITRPCSKHGDGSFIIHLHTEHIKYLPRSLLEYEILETHYAGKDRPSSPRRRPSPEGEPDAPHGAAGHG